MGWYGYETTRHEETRSPICRVVLDLFDLKPGGAAVSIHMGESGGNLPQSHDEREALAEVLQGEFEAAMRELLLT